MRRSAAWGSLLLGALVLAPGTASAQDIEVAAQRAGRQLPQGYYTRVKSNPDFFAVKGGWIERAVANAAAGTAVEGTMPLVAVLALFSDSPVPHLDEQDLRQVLFDGPAADGTLSEYYTEVSGGRFGITGEALAWVRTSLTRAEVVGSEYGLGGDSRVGEYLVDALTQLDISTDFGQFDSDGPDNAPNSGDDNGVVDALAVYFLEVAASCGGPGIWPHFSGLTPWTGQPFETNDLRPDGSRIKIDPYFIQSIVDCGGVQLGGIRVMAHELGHLIGLPDHYHPVDGLLPEQRRWVIGCWSLMAAGQWGCGPLDAPMPTNRPPHFGAWDKKRLGWLDEIELLGAVEIGELTLSPVRTSGKILEVPLGNQERLLIEYRDQGGFDRDIPAEGVLVYRVNDTIPWRPCAECLPVYQVQLLEADGDSALVKTHPQGGDRGVPGDAYGASGAGALTDLTEPSSRHHAGLGDPSGVNIYEIRLESGSARLVYSTALISPSRLLGPLLLDDAHPLTVQEEDYLDQRNNRNGRYDVGDLRAYLLESVGGSQ